MTARLSHFDLVRMADVLAGTGDWFSAQLMRLIAKSDHEDLERLRLAFPDHVEAWEAWRIGGRVWDSYVAERVGGR